jgi:hypothetical protein
MEQDHIAGGALYQGADIRLVVPADDQVAFPVAGHHPVGDLDRTLGDHHLVADALGREQHPALGPPADPPGAQAPGQLGAEHAAGLHEQRGVDGLVGDAHARVIGEVADQPGRDLLWRPALRQALLDMGPQHGVHGELGRFGTPGPGLGQPVGLDRSVAA